MVHEQFRNRPQSSLVSALLFHFNYLLLYSMKTPRRTRLLITIIMKQRLQPFLSTSTRPHFLSMLPLHDPWCLMSSHLLLENPIMLPYPLSIFGLLFERVVDYFCQPIDPYPNSQIHHAASLSPICLSSNLSDIVSRLYDASMCMKGWLFIRAASLPRPVNLTRHRG